MSDGDVVDPKPVEGEPDNSTPSAEVDTSTSSIDGLQQKIAKLEENLKSANAEAKERRLKLKEFEESQKKQTEKSLEEDKQYKTLYETAKAEREALQDRMMNTAINSKIEAVAIKEGLRDSSLINNIDKTTVVFDDESLTVYGVEEAVSEAKKKFPFLFESNETPKNPTAKAPAFDDATGDVTLEEMKGWTKDKIVAHFRKKRERDAKKADIPFSQKISRPLG